MKRSLSILSTLIVVGLFLGSCMLPGMIPLNSTPEGPMPEMETNTETVLEVLKEQGWNHIQLLAQEQYTDEDLGKPGTLTFTVNVTDDLPVYFSYGWCATDEVTLKQNFEHIDVSLFINGVELGDNVVHQLTYTSQGILPCLDHGVLLSNWPEGEYDLKAVATFDDKINDGMADFEPGDYIFEYNVTVKKQKEGA